MELLYDARGNLRQALLWVQRQQLPGQVERVVEVAALVLALRDELVLELLEELEMVEVFFGERLDKSESTSSPMTAFMAAVSLAAA